MNAWVLSPVSSGPPKIAGLSSASAPRTRSSIWVSVVGSTRGSTRVKRRSCSKSAVGTPIQTSSASSRELLVPLHSLTRARRGSASEECRPVAASLPGIEVDSAPSAQNPGSRALQPANCASCPYLTATIAAVAASDGVKTGTVPPGVARSSIQDPGRGHMASVRHLPTHGTKWTVPAPAAFSHWNSVTRSPPSQVQNPVA